MKKKMEKAHGQATDSNCPLQSSICRGSKCISEMTQKDCHKKVILVRGTDAVKVAQTSASSLVLKKMRVQHHTPLLSYKRLLSMSNPLRTPNRQQ